MSVLFDRPHFDNFYSPYC